MEGTIDKVHTITHQSNTLKSLVLCQVVHTYQYMSRGICRHTLELSRTPCHKVAHNVLQGHLLVTKHLCDTSLCLQVTLIKDDIFPDQHPPTRLVYQSVPTRTPTVPHHHHLRSLAVELSPMLCRYVCIRSTPKYS